MISYRFSSPSPRVLRPSPRRRVSVLARVQGSWALLGVLVAGGLLGVAGCARGTAPGPGQVSPVFEQRLAAIVAADHAGQGWRSPAAAVQVLGVSPDGGAVFVWVEVIEAGPRGTQRSAPARIILPGPGRKVEVAYPGLGSAYAPTVKDLFPPAIARRVLNREGIDFPGLEQRARARARALTQPPVSGARSLTPRAGHSGALAANTTPSGRGDLLVLPGPVPHGRYQATSAQWLVLRRPGLVGLAPGTG